MTALHITFLLQCSALSYINAPKKRELSESVGMYKTPFWAALSPGLGLLDPGRRTGPLSEGNVYQEVSHQPGRKGSLQVSAIKVQGEHGWWRHV